jgi:hypothetical protein
LVFEPGVAVSVHKRPLLSESGGGEAGDRDDDESDDDKHFNASDL